MSILDNQVELDEAKLRLGATDEDELVRDLAYWSVVEADHRAEYAELEEKQQAVGALHAEAHRWAALITAEIRTRRDAKRSRADG